MTTASINNDVSNEFPLLATPNGKQLRSRMIWQIILGQVIAVQNVGTGVFSTLLSNRDIHVPTFQSLSNYILLQMYFVPLYIRRRSNDSDAMWYSLLHPRYSKWWLYACIALFDVEGNFFVVQAYSLTSIISVQLQDCLAQPIVMLLSWLFLHSKYNWKQLVACSICLVGVALCVFTDIQYGDRSKDDQQHFTEDAILGDLCVLAGCLCYALSNIGQEKAMKHEPQSPEKQKPDDSDVRYEFLAFLGLFGSIFSAIQTILLERNKINQITWSGPVIGYFCGFTCCIFLVYSSVPFIMAYGSALLYNLSLLTADPLTVLAAVLIFHDSVHFLYVIAFIIIIGGIQMYNFCQSQETQMDDSPVISDIPNIEDSIHPEIPTDIHYN